MIKTAFILTIGDEILSGKTQDKNINYLAKRLKEMGIKLSEVRFIPDCKKTIISNINYARANFDYVFTTGGIGPTHDDMTTESIAEAVGVETYLHPKAHAAMTEYYKTIDKELNEARLKMAYVPQGAELVENSITAAPGFKIENIFVFAGVPSIMQVMFEAVTKYLEGGDILHTLSLDSNSHEGDYAGSLSAIAAKYPNVDIGSYPHYEEGKSKVTITISGYDIAALEDIRTEIKEIL